MRPHSSSATTRTLAIGGILGPVTFIAAWAIAGAVTTGYSPVDGAISDLAAVDASTRIGMTFGFVVFGVGLVGFGVALRRSLPGPAGIAAALTGACTLGVAATPLGGWSGDGVHAAFAGLGYVALVATPALAAGPLARAGSRFAAGASIAVAVVAGGFLAASTLGPAHGLWQRLGLTAGDAWIVTVASMLVATGSPTGRRRP